MSIEFSERIRRIPVYPAADGYALDGEVALLASNESPYPPLPAVVEAAAAALAGVNRYPDPSNAALRRALSDRHGVPANRIAIGNGSCDILLAAGEALLEPGAEIVYAWPSFSVYPHLAAASGARAIEVPLDDDHRHDLDAMAKEINAATRLVIVCNPNNPTSTALPLAEISDFVASVPRHVAVILDEAYVEFSLLQDAGDSLDLLAKHPNLVLLRTFSKIYGLCGLRVGYGLCGSESFRTAVDQVRQPFFCNAAAQAAAIEALKHQDEVARRVERNLAERTSLDRRPRGARAERRRVAGELHLVRRRRERARDRQGARSARRARARRGRARPGRGAARHGRHAGRERALRRDARRAAVDAAAAGGGARGRGAAPVRGPRPVPARRQRAARRARAGRDGARHRPHAAPARTARPSRPPARTGSSPRRPSRGRSCRATGRRRSTSAASRSRASAGWASPAAPPRRSARAARAVMGLPRFRCAIRPSGSSSTASTSPRRLCCSSVDCGWVGVGEGCPGGSGDD